MSEETDDIQARTRTAGQVVFVGAALILTLILLSQITSETSWVADESFAAQPRFWPAVGILSMAAGFALHFWQMKRRRPGPIDWAEARRWVEPLEYLGWFMAYVFLVPQVGFLPMSLIFACALTWRLGYRTPLYIGLAAGFAIATVLLFKGFLGVKIPGAALYELLPGGLRGFFILYL